MKAKRNFLSAKYLVVFVVGMLSVVFTYAYVTIDNNVGNAVQYIKTIVLTDNGGADGSTGIFLDGDNGKIKGNQLEMGYGSQALGSYSMAIGNYVSSTGTYSIAMGNHTRAIGNFSTVIGKDNVGLTGSLFEIGMGSDDLNRANALTVLDNGNIGVGVSAPAQKLEVNGNIQMSFPNTWIGQVANQIHFGTNGNVGIGTGTPQYKLEVNGSGRFNNSLAIGQYATVGKDLTVSNDLVVNNKVGIGASPSHKLQVVGDTYLNGNVGIGIIPSTYALGVSGTTVLNGNVGIGSFTPGSPPSAALEIKTSAAPAIKLTSTNGGMIPASIDFDGYGSIVMNRYISSPQKYMKITSTTYPLIFAVSGSDRMTIDTAGNVGIGITPSSSYRLDVGGTTRTNTLVVDYIGGMNSSTINISKDHNIQADKNSASLNLYGPNDGSSAPTMGKIVIGDDHFSQFGASVGIGYRPTSDDKAKLQVNGALRLIKLGATTGQNHLNNNLGLCTTGTAGTMGYLESDDSIGHLAICMRTSLTDYGRLEIKTDTTIP